MVEVKIVQSNVILTNSFENVTSSKILCLAFIPRINRQRSKPKKEMYLKVLLVELILMVVWDHLESVQNINPKFLSGETRLDCVPVKVK